MTAAEVASFLSAPSTGVLTTLDREGWPHSVAMWFVPAEDHLLMWAYRRSQKAVNARRDPRASFLVEDGKPYEELRGILIRGELDLIESFDELRALGISLYDRYTKPSLGLEVSDGPIAEIERQARKRVGLRMPYERITSWDHRKL